MKDLIVSGLRLISGLSFKANAQETTKLNGNDLLHNLVIQHIQETKDPLNGYDIDSSQNGSFMIMDGGVHGQENDAVEYLVLMKGRDSDKNKRLDISEIENGELHYYTQDAHGQATETTYLFDKNKDGEYLLFTAIARDGETLAFGKSQLIEQIFEKDQELGRFDHLGSVLKEVNRLNGKQKDNFSSPSRKQNVVTVQL